MVKEEKKKTIYDLTFKEGKKLENEFRNTSYGRNFYILSIFAVGVPFFVACALYIERLIDALNGKGSFSLDTTEVLLFVIGMILYCVLRISWIKKKKIFYDEKKK